MNRDEILAKLRATERELRARGVMRAALFGSRARGDSVAGSDIDILVDFDPQARVTVYDYVGIKDYVAEIFDAPVDVLDREGLRPAVAARIEATAIYAF